MEEPLRSELVDQGPVMFYDGVCGLCNAAVQALIKMDRGSRIRYAPLQGETARRVLKVEEGETEFASMVLVDSSGVHHRSAAAIRAAVHTGGAYRGLVVLLVVPAFVRDWVYCLVAKNRYRWFGKHDSCPIPSPQLRARFLP